jgi:hypothetical protein
MANLPSTLFPPGYSTDHGCLARPGWEAALSELAQPVPCAEGTQDEQNPTRHSHFRRGFWFCYCDGYPLLEGMAYQRA